MTSVEEGWDKSVIQTYMELLVEPHTWLVCVVFSLLGHIWVGLHSYKVVLLLYDASGCAANF